MGPRISKKIIRKHFNRAAKSYAGAAVLQHEIADRLLSRLDFMKIKPVRILDCGARDGYSSKLLRERYPKSEIISCDLSEALLQQHSRRWFQRRLPRICVDYENLPFAARSFDLIFSNLALHWSNDIHAVFQQFYRLLTPNGLLLFTTVGPDTLKELRISGASVHDFIDMHDIGDALMKAHYLDPVMDMEHLQIRYDSVNRLIADLKSTGVTQAQVNGAKGLGGRVRWQQILSAYPQSLDKVFNATIEIIYGHAWLPEQPDLGRMDLQGEVRVPISILKKK